MMYIIGFPSCKCPDCKVGCFILEIDEDYVEVMYDICNVVASITGQDMFICRESLFKFKDVFSVYPSQFFFADFADAAHKSYRFFINEKVVEYFIAYFSALDLSTTFFERKCLTDIAENYKEYCKLFSIASIIE